MADLTLVVAFTETEGDVPSTGLTLADIDLYLTAAHRTTGALTVIWDGTEHPTFEVTNTGSYGRVYAGADQETYNYVGGGLYTGVAVLDNEWVSGAASATEPPTADVTDAIWGYATRTLTQSAASVAAAVAGSSLTIKRGDSWSASLTGIGVLTDSSKLWFTVKDNLADADSASIIQIDDDTGLLYLNGADASARAANGSITVDDAAAGNITIALDEAETDDLVKAQGLYYDVQMLDTSDDVTTMVEGPLDVVGDVTRSIT